MAIRFIYFDCMDTLIQMQVPDLDVYAGWAYEGAAPLGLWRDAESFGEDWRRHRDLLLARGDHREGTILARLRDLLRERLIREGSPWPEARLEEEAARIHHRYWERYRAAAFVLPEVPETLARLQRERELPLGVVSNFMVEGGIALLLREHSLDRYFQVVLVSCEHGFRKPAGTIFRAAIRAAGAAPGEILFIGDNLVADYQAPRAAGMASLLYDRRRLHPDVEHRIESFPEIEAWLEGPRGNGR